MLGLLILFHSLSLEASDFKYFDVNDKRCKEAKTSDTLNSVSTNVVGPCYEGKLSNIDFNETQKIKGIERLLLIGSKTDNSYIRNQKIHNLILDYSSSRQSVISLTTFNYLRAIKADLRGIRIIRSQFYNFSFMDADLQGTKITNSIFKGGDFKRTNFKGAIITDTQFEDCLYSKEIRRSAILINVSFKNCQEIDE